RDYEATLAQARAEANRTIEEAPAAAAPRRGHDVARASPEVAPRRAPARAALEGTRAAAPSALGGAVGELAVSAASRVVQADLDVASNQATVDEYVNQAGGSR